MRWKRIALFALAAIAMVMVSSSLALAAEETSSGRAIWDTVWRFINFFILAFLIVKYGRKPLMNFLANHSKEIGELVQDAESQVAQAEADYKEAQEKLDQIQKTIAEIETLYREEGERAYKRILQDADALSAQMIEEAKELATMQVQKAMESVKTELVDAAFGEAEKLIRQKIDKNDENRILSSYLVQINAAE